MRLLLAALLLVHGAAMGQTFACQYTASAGLKWENGQWAIKNFRMHPPFFLKIEADALILDSVAKAVRASQSRDIRCEKAHYQGTFSCFDQLGGFMLFDPKTASGGVAQLLGAVVKADTPSVAPFTCQQM